MALSFVRQASLVALLATSTIAQTFTECDPTKKACPADPGLPQSNYEVDFTKGADDSAWKVASGKVSYSADGAQFVLAKQGDAPTIQTSWYFFFGRAEVIMKAAPGTGIVSSVVVESDDLDEVDWEWLGGKDAQVQTNYFGKGNTTTFDRGAFHNVDGTQDDFHNYTIDWTPDAVTWYINSNLVRTLNFADAVGGKNFPQTPARLRLGIWAGGDPNNSPGTIEWAGGPTDYSKGPYTMTVQKVAITNSNPGKSYTYSDQTGDWQSIKVEAAGASTGDGTSSGQNDTSAAPASPSAPVSPPSPASTPAPASGTNAPANAIGAKTSANAPAATSASGSSDSASASSPASVSAAAGRMLGGSAVSAGLVGIALAALVGLL
ncbi:glycosyl hydrolase family 16 [Colletotrichum graminicola]|uniref:Crh-like protein n=1 Tax=Colletotrichum graminicola (strain M1.001 / M2 / FGSC 10212) TaxID=645133 RepID=E3QK20_COLGM|nr:glycosyl hydrolase family 16 [Colletotrichum graminicola M1.001]EFQ31208.1 glycosyl hydrolase family 16 [Colletotrichum graminicola M1.001]WDK19199.1 glycosyl hydrolase family 16 [Colletotrichum graminicola]